MGGVAACKWVYSKFQTEHPPRGARGGGCAGGLGAPHSALWGVGGLASPTKQALTGGAHAHVGVLRLRTQVGWGAASPRGPCPVPEQFDQYTGSLTSPQSVEPPPQTPPNLI